MALGGPRSRTTGRATSVCRFRPAGNRTSLIWDGDNRLTQVVLPAGVRNTFAYDGDGYRVVRQDSAGTANIVWDGENVLCEMSPGGILIAQYTTAGGSYGPVVSLHRSGASQFYLFDGLGSTDRLTDASGVVTDRYLYEGYGALRLTQGSSINPYRYVGQLGYAFDPDAGQYYVQARYYRPDLARFLSVDRVRDAGRDLYWYAIDNPLSWVDPSGLVAAGLWWGLRGLVPPIPPLGPLFPILAVGVTVTGVASGIYWAERLKTLQEEGRSPR